MSGMDNGLQKKRCSAPLPHKVADRYISLRIAQEAGNSEESATATVTRWAEVYTLIWEHQGRPMDSLFQSREQEEADLYMSPYISG